MKLDPKNSQEVEARQQCVSSILVWRQSIENLVLDLLVKKKIWWLGFGLGNEDKSGGGFLAGFSVPVFVSPYTVITPVVVGLSERIAELLG